MSTDLKDETKEQSLERILSELTGHDRYEQVSYIKDNPGHLDFDLRHMLDVGTFVDFISESQARRYQSLCMRAPNMADKKLVEGFVNAVEAHGLLYVLRNGFEVLGTPFLAFEPLPENREDL